MLTKIKYLKDGTLFHINNGHWDGYVTIEDGEKVMYTGVDKYNPTGIYVNRMVLDDKYKLDIDILEGGKEYHFDVAEVTNDLINWIRDWFEENGKDCNAVLGMSGGKDSTIAAALCVKALGKDRVIGVLLPNGKQSDIEDAYEVCNYLDIPFYEINIKEGVDATLNHLRKAGITITDQCIQNIAPRERTKVIRAICQCHNGRMVNTCNLSEDYIGYFTIGGDGDGDFSPFADLTATEVVSIGHYLGLPKHLIDKTPSDGLCGKSDEDNFGFTYKQLDTYIRIGDCIDSVKELILRRHNANVFKLRPRPKFRYNP